MSKTTQKDAGEETVTAKSKPMMNLVSRCSERNPDVLASTASESPDKTRCDSQIPRSSWFEQHLRAVRPVKDAHSSNYSGRNADEKLIFSRVEIWWSDGSKKGETCSWTVTWFVRRAHGQICCWWRWYGLWHRHRIRHVVKIQIILAQGEWSSAKDSGPILKRCNERQQQTLCDMGECFCLQHWQHLYSWRRITQTIGIPSKNTGNNLRVKQMFNISEKLIVGQSDEIYGVNTINSVDNSWKRLSLIGDEEVISLSHAKVYVFSDSVLCKMSENPQSNTVWEQQLVQDFTTMQSFGHNWWWANGIRVEYFPRIHHIAALQQSPRVPVKNERKARSFTGRIIFMSLFNDISWRSPDNEQECELNANFVSIYARRFSTGRWSFLGPGSEKKWYSTHVRKPQGEWDRVAELMVVKFGESGHPVFRATSPLSRGTLTSRGGGKLSIHFCAGGRTIEIVFSHNQFC